MSASLPGSRLPLASFPTGLIGGPRGHAAQRVHDGNGIFLAKDLPAAGDAVDRRPHGEQGINGRYERVVVVAEQDAAFQGAAERADALGAIRAEEDVAVAVAPEVGVDHEERRHHAEALDTVELILAHGLAVDDDVPGVGAGIALLRFQASRMSWMASSPLPWMAIRQLPRMQSHDAIDEPFRVFLI